MTAAPPVAVTRPERPYPGLRPFEPEEWAIFFGREEMVDEVIGRLAQNRLVLIHGVSGSGKSSLVRAGILPKLALQHRGHDAPWLTCAMRPSGGPLWNLAAEFAQLEGRAGDLERIGQIAGQFNARSASLASVAASLEGVRGKSLCVLVDQFEELFRYEKDTSRDEAKLFVDLIERAAAAEGEETPSDGVDLHVIITMRSEFLGECARFAGFAETINRTQYLVPRIDDDGLLRAVRRPAQMYGGVIDDALAERLTASVRGREDELPLLQHGLMLMWEDAVRRAVPGERVRLDGAIVDNAGGLAELLSRHADDVMASAAPDERRQRIVEAVFRALTDVNSEGSAIRRPLAFQKLCAVTGAKPEELRPILNAFRAPGVSFITPYEPKPIDDKTPIDVSHEALIRCWRRINDKENGWLQKEFRLGQGWRTFLFQAESFANDKSNYLSEPTTELGERRLKEQNEAWAERYGGGWVTVAAHVDASRAHWEREREDAQEKLRITNDLLARTTNIIARSQVHLDRETQEDAFRVFQAGANLGYVNSMLNLGLCYRGGWGVAQDYIKAGEWFEKAADKGDEDAMRELGMLYANGRGVAPDYAKAREWYEKAADKGDADAMTSLGVLYHNGYGVAQDYIKAREWYEKAADKGDASGMTWLGVLYANGYGVAEDYAKARQWFEMAADKGDAAAMRNLGALCANVQGVAQDYVKAREWFEKAADKGDADAMRNLGALCANGQGVAQDYAKAREWYEKAADKGDADAMTSLGVLYHNGYGVAQDYIKAREWYEKAADKGDASGMTWLGVLYANGYGVAQDYAKAREWFEMAADKGEAAAMRNLGVLCANGRGVSQDYAKAREWYEKAADKGDATAMLNLGLLYANGRGVAQDYAKARQWFEMAADKGAAGAMTGLGVLYDNGQGVAPDYAKAREWFEKAADKGDADAMRNLGVLYDLGHGVAQDYARARERYEKAADKGDADAMRNLGVLYDLGHGVAEDYAKAREWYEKAADKSDADAMRNLGLLYDLGQGVAQDYAKAREWYEKAADKGDAGAMTSLGVLYDNGQGVAQDYAKAREWYERAADKGDARAMRNLENLSISEAAAAGRYAEALQLAEACAAKEEAAETKREGNPGKETAQAFIEVAWRAVLAREFSKALAAADRAHALLPDDLLVETNRADALMFLGRGEESEALYVAHKGKRMSEQDGRIWEAAIAEDFAELRKAGLTHPMMAGIETKLGIAP